MLEEGVVRINNQQISYSNRYIFCDLESIIFQAVSCSPVTSYLPSILSYLSPNSLFCLRLNYRRVVPRSRLFGRRFTTFLKGPRTTSPKKRDLNLQQYQQHQQQHHHLLALLANSILLPRDWNHLKGFACPERSRELLRSAIGEIVGISRNQQFQEDSKE